MKMYMHYMYLAVKSVPFFTELPDMKIAELRLPT